MFMLLFGISGIILVAVAVIAWIARGGQQWQLPPKEYPYMYLYDPTGEKTYMWQNEDYLSRFSRH